jgi:hypothetical protein
VTKNCPQFIRQVDCIVSVQTNAPFINYNNKRYYNQFPGNKTISLYK